MAVAFTNKHITRSLVAGYDASTIDSSWLDTVNGWLTPDDDMRVWVDASFGVIKSGSVISKIANLGATRLPWIGDLTTATANTSYVTGGSGIGGLPAWNNANNSAFSFFGTARAGTIRSGQIRRLYRTGITMVAVYSKTGTTLATPLGFGQFNSGIYLQNTAGNPGNASFFVGGFSGSWTAPDTSTATIANSAVHIIGGTFDGPSLAVKVYNEGVAAGSGATGTNYFPLLGGYNDTKYILVSGSSGGLLNYGSTSADDPASPTGATTESAMTIHSVMMFGTTFSPTRMASLNTLLRNRIGP